MNVGLSVIIPAYNESKRLPPYLQSARTYLSRTWDSRYEVLVVDDGSEDGMWEVVQRLRDNWPQLMLIRHPMNRGKGAAIQTGVSAASGELLLLADADGATPIEEVSELQAAIERGADVAIGSRLLRGATPPERLRSRALCGLLFAALVRRLFAMPLRDTQCGFKMFRLAVAQDVFRFCNNSGYLLDVEVLAWAVRRGYGIAEVPVRWMDVPGSKVRLLRDGWRMCRGLWDIRRALGI